MKIDVVIGGMYGDEGKGKVVNYLHTKNKYDAVFRVNASTNASHCVNMVGCGEQVTKQLPSVFFDDKVKLVVSPGAFLNLHELKNELLLRPDNKEIKGNVIISDKIPLILDGYIKYNKTNEFISKVGSTNQGTGIGMIARVSRHSLYLSNIKNLSISKLTSLIKNSYTQLGITIDSNDIRETALQLKQDYTEIIDCVGEFCYDYTEFLSNLQDDTNVLIEGCNGVLLDNIFGVTPFVTSCSTTLPGLLSYANMSPFDLNEAYVVIGAYNVCLNERPFLTEIKEDVVKNHILSNNSEIDGAEDMQRRIGWFDVPATKRSLISHRGCKLILSKTDVLNGLEKIKICVGYKDSNGKIYDIMPDDTRMLYKLSPIYEEVDGYNDKDQNLKNYINKLQSYLPCDIEYIGYGKESNKIFKNE